jgi:hypothetical protein
VQKVPPAQQVLPPKENPCVTNQPFYSPIRPSNVIFSKPRGLFPANTRLFLFKRYHKPENNVNQKDKPSPAFWKSPSAVGQT